MEFATSYFGNRALRHVQRDMQQLSQEGFSIVVHTFSENDLRFYGRTMQDIVAATADLGLKVWLDPWGLGGVFGGEAFSHVALHEPSWCQIRPDGSRLPACCPNNPGFRAFVGEWLDAACAMDVEAVFFDEPHFYPETAGQVAGCACEHCRACSERESNASSVVDFLHWSCAQAEQRGKKSVVCLLPDDRAEGATDWKAVARARGLDNLGTGPYWALRGEQARDCVTGFGQQAVAAASQAGLRSHVWIQGFQIPAGREQEITTAVLAAARTGTDVIAVWGFEACAAMSALACERPHEAWRAFLEGMSRARSECEAAG